MGIGTGSVPIGDRPATRASATKPDSCARQCESVECEGEPFQGEHHSDSYVPRRRGPAARRPPRRSRSARTTRRSRMLSPGRGLRRRAGRGGPTGGGPWVPSSDRVSATSRSSPGWSPAGCRPSPSRSPTWPWTTPRRRRLGAAAATTRLARAPRRRRAGGAGEPAAPTTTGRTTGACAAAAALPPRPRRDAGPDRSVSVHRDRGPAGRRPRDRRAPGRGARPGGRRLRHVGPRLADAEFGTDQDDTGTWAARCRTSRPAAAPALAMTVGSPPSKTLTQAQ
jgi:hypothetical protein